jgi:hypothetical protein
MPFKVLPIDVQPGPDDDPTIVGLREAAAAQTGNTLSVTTTAGRNEWALKG